MFKIVAILAFCVTVGHAGYFGAPVAYSAPVVAAPFSLAHAPVAIAHAPIVKAAIPVATSYQNSNLVSQGAVQVVAAAPVYKTAPVFAAAPVYKTAPVLAAPAVFKSPLFAYGHHY